MKTLALVNGSSRPIDLALAVNVGTGDTYEWSKVLLARATFNGTLRRAPSASCR